MAAQDNEQTMPRGLRSLRSKRERRERLRLRVPQAEDVGTPSEPDSDSESEDDTESIADEDESDDDTETDEPERVDSPLQPNPSGNQPTAPGFVTLVPPSSQTQGLEQPVAPTRISQPPAPPASEVPERPIPTLDPPDEPSATDGPSQTVEPPESIVNTLPEFVPSTFISSTITADPGNPSEPAGPPVEEDQESLISDTSLIASTTAEPTGVPTEDAEQVGANDGGGGSNRGADVGIIIGTMALASLIVAACVLFYRRRKKANNDHLTRLDAKTLPPPPSPPVIPGGENGGSPGRLQFSSWANFVRPNGEEGCAAGYYAGNEKRGVPASPVSPAAPPTAHGAAGAFRSLTGQEPPSPMASRYNGGRAEGRLVPPPTHLAPPPRADIHPPGQVPISQFRAPSMAQSQMTDSTEGTWRTWGVDQSRPKGKGSSQQRYPG